MKEPGVATGKQVPIPFRKRKRTKLSIGDAFKAMKAAALALEESYRLTDIQEAAIHKCFQLIQTSSVDLQSSVLRQKSTRSMTVYLLLHDIRYLLGLKPFLLCALALTPTCMQTLGKDDAAKFPSKLQSWWKASGRPSTKLEALANKFKAVDDNIMQISPDVQLCKALGKQFLE